MKPINNFLRAFQLSGVSRGESFSYLMMFLGVSLLDVLSLGILPNIISTQISFYGVDVPPILFSLIFVMLIFLKSIVGLYIHDRIVNFSLSLRERLIVRAVNHINLQENYDLSEANTSISVLIEKFSGLLIREGLKAIAEVITAVSIIIYLLITEPQISVGVIFIFFLSYMFYDRSVRSMVRRLGERLNNASELQFRLLSWIITGKRTLLSYKVLGRLSRRFTKVIRLYNAAQRRFLVLSAVPKYLFEFSAAVSFVYVFVCFELLGYTDTSQLTVLAVLGFSIFRLLPSIRSVSSTAIQFSFHSDTITRLEKIILNEPSNLELKQEISFQEQPCEANRGIKLVNLTIFHGAKCLIKGFSFDFDVGHVYRFIGPSGSGKSTLLDTICGFHPQFTGKLTFDDGSKFNRHSTCLIPQEPFIFKGTIRQNITFQNFLTVDMELRLIKLMRSLGLIADQLEPDSFVEDGGVNISGGQAQRIELCRALFSDKHIILMDEPTSALDQENTTKTLRLLEEISSEKIIIVVTHDLEFKTANDITIEMRNIIHND